MHSKAGQPGPTSIKEISLSDYLFKEISPLRPYGAPVEMTGGAIRFAEISPLRSK